MAYIFAKAIHRLFIFRLSIVLIGCSHHDNCHLTTNLANRTDEAQSRRKTMPYDYNFLIHSNYTPNRLTRPFPGTIL